MAAAVPPGARASVAVRVAAALAVVEVLEPAAVADQEAVAVVVGRRR